jgi:hypothetical protein
MFLSNHRINFQKFERYKGKAINEELSYLVFNLIHHLLVENYLKDASNEFDNLSEELINESFKYARDGKNPEEFKKKKIILDKLLKNRSKALLHNENFINNIISAYLLTFYKFNYLIEDYKSNFEKLSYWEFKKLDFEQIEIRNEELITNNIAALLDRLKSPLEGIKQSKSNTSSIASTFEIHGDRFLNNFFQLNKYKIELDGFSDSIIRRCKQELNKKKQNNPYILNAFYKLVSDEKHHSLTNSLYDINTYSINETYNKLLKIINNKPISIELPFHLPIHLWHEALKNISSALLQKELIEDMKYQFKYRTNYSSRYYVTSIKDLVNRYGQIELAKHTKIDANHLAVVLTSKGTKIDNSVELFDEENVRVRTKEDIEFEKNKLRQNSIIHRSLK